jgi:hypothetical protein
VVVLDQQVERARVERVVDAVLKGAGFTRGGKDIELTDEDREVSDMNMRLRRRLDWDRLQAAAIAVAGG